VNQGTINLSKVLQRYHLWLNGGCNVIVDPYQMGYIGILGDRNSRGFSVITNPAILAAASSTTSKHRQRSTFPTIGTPTTSDCVTTKERFGITARPKSIIVTDGEWFRVLAPRRGMSGP
jgi:hypothetical protein